MVKTDKKRVVLGMSGGIDSSVALFLLREQGFEVIGISLKFGFWESEKNEAGENICCSKESIKRARAVCQKYNCPHFVVDASEEFQKTVIDYFLKTLKRNRTPSPCVFCNRDVKIKILLRLAREKGAGWAATGHYARIRKKGRERQLLRAKDREKDQTYFLSLLKQSQLSKLIFPLGGYTKEEVYNIAQKEGIEVPSRQSQDLCFVSDKSLPNFLEEEIGLRPGEIRDTQGNFLGRHQGLYFYTRGQRKGINLPGGPFWVVGLKEKDNILIVSRDPRSPKLFNRAAALRGVSFVSGKAPKTPLEVKAKVRFRQPLSKAVLYSEEGSKKGNSPKWRLVFEEPQRAITPGQIAAFYQGEACLGGGVIIK